MDIKERLKRLDSISSGAQQSREEIISDLRRRLERLVDPQRKKGVHKRPHMTTEWLEGEEVATPFGMVFMRQQIYGSGHRHGEMLLDRVMEIPTYPVSLLSEDENLRDLDFSRTVYLDVETTGLTGGTGTCAFLVGVGYFEGNRFVTQQLFLRDFTEERAMLWLLSELVRDFRFLVTFNGKRFDIPLLENRFILARMDSPFRDLPNYDLLFPSRRIWRGAYEDCRLATIESSVLGIYREDDVPSELIPYIYFDYLRNGNESEIPRVFYHNRMDVLSLVTLAARIHDLVDAPQTYGRREWIESYAIGKLLARQGRRAEAIDCFHNALRCCKDAREWEILKSLSLARKREKQMERATSIWMEMISLERGRELFPYEELAKFYEHQVKDHSEALRWVEEAFEAVAFINPLERNALRHRRQRLYFKIERGKTKRLKKGEGC